MTVKKIELPDKFYGFRLRAYYLPHQMPPNSEIVDTHKDYDIYQNKLLKGFIHIHQGGDTQNDIVSFVDEEFIAKGSEELLLNQIDRFKKVIDTCSLLGIL